MFLNNHSLRGRYFKSDEMTYNIFFLDIALSINSLKLNKEVTWSLCLVVSI